MSCGDTVDPCAEQELGCNPTIKDECVIASNSFDGCISVLEGDTYDEILAKILNQLCALTESGTDIYVESGVYDDETGVLTLTLSDDSTVDIDLSLLQNTDYEGRSGIELNDVNKFDWDGALTKNVNITGGDLYDIIFTGIKAIQYQTLQSLILDAGTTLDVIAGTKVNIDSNRVDLVQVPPTSPDATSVLFRDTTGEIKIRSLSSILPDPDGVVDGASFDGSILTLTRTEGLSDITVDISSLGAVPEDYVQNVQLVGEVLQFTGVGSAFGGSVDLQDLSDGVVTSLSIIGGNTLQATRSNGLPNLTVALPAAGGGGEEYHRIEINQVGHGFTLPAYGFIPVTNSGAGWAAADCSSAATLHEGYVVEITDLDNFDLQQSGYITVISHGLTVGQYYFLEDGVGGNIVTSPNSETYDAPVCFVVDANTIQLLDTRPVQIDGGSNPLVDVYVDNMLLAGTILTLERTEGFGDLTVDIANLLGISVQDEGVNLPSNPYTVLNFIGNSVTASDVGGVATIDINTPWEKVGDSIQTIAYGTDSLQIDGANGEEIYINEAVLHDNNDVKRAGCQTSTLNNQDQYSSFISVYSEDEGAATDNTANLWAIHNPHDVLHKWTALPTPHADQIDDEVIDPVELLVGAVLFFNEESAPRVPNMLVPDNHTSTTEAPSSVVGADGRIYAFYSTLGDDYADLQIYDPRTNTFCVKEVPNDRAGVVPAEYRTAICYSKNGFIYGIPSYVGCPLVEYDPYQDKFREISLVGMSGEWRGAVEHPNGYFYCAPYKGTADILSYNPLTDTLTMIDHSATTGYPIRDQATELDHVSTNVGFYGATLHPKNGKIYFCPAVSSKARNIENRGLGNSIMELDPVTTPNTPIVSLVGTFLPINGLLTGHESFGYQFNGIRWCPENDFLYCSPFGSSGIYGYNPLNGEEKYVPFHQLTSTGAPLETNATGDNNAFERAGRTSGSIIANDGIIYHLGAIQNRNNKLLIHDPERPQPQQIVFTISTASATSETLTIELDAKSYDVAITNLTIANQLEEIKTNWEAAGHDAFWTVEHDSKDTLTFKSVDTEVHDRDISYSVTGGTFVGSFLNQYDVELIVTSGSTGDTPTHSIWISLYNKFYNVGVTTGSRTILQTIQDIVANWAAADPDGEWSVVDDGVDKLTFTPTNPNKKYNRFYARGNKEVNGGSYPCEIPYIPSFPTYQNDCYTAQTANTFAGYFRHNVFGGTTADFAYFDRPLVSTYDTTLSQTTTPTFTYIVREGSTSAGTMIITLSGIDYEISLTDQSGNIANTSAEIKSEFDSNHGASGWTIVDNGTSLEFSHASTYDGKPPMTIKSDSGAYMYLQGGVSHNTGFDTNGAVIGFDGLIRNAHGLRMYPVGKPKKGYELEFITSPLINKY